ncbi:transcription factor GTE1 isoform X2 [Quercus suber]|uniref:transcription factor GTE1 isoform X2 n=1 Tax=Quercus suber TaxID=58331 RepID=UPI0032DF2DC5
MDPMNAANPENAAEVEYFSNRVDEIFTKVDKIEKQVSEVEQFYLASSNSSIVKDKEREKHFPGVKKQRQDASHREVAASKRMQELMRQFATILRQVIEKPMDFSTIEKKMDAKDGTGYKNVREIYADVRLVFKNAMIYNEEKDDVHVMAKTLLAKFEEKWLQLLPKVAEEERRQTEEDVEAKLNMQRAQDAAYAKMARDLSSELYEFDMHLKKLREMVVQKCRKMSSEEKRSLGTALTQLSPEDLSKALEIVAETNPSFQATAQEVDLDIDAQSEYTLWRLKAFVKDSLKGQARNPGGISGSGNNNDNNDDNKKSNSKRKREICDALAKTAVKRTKKLSSL